MSQSNHSLAALGGARGENQGWVRVTPDSARWRVTGTLLTMNDTTPPPNAPQGDNGPSDTRGSDRFFTWLRDLGITRSGDRWIAGVAGGIAAKAKIDPIIVRGVFIVLAVLGGPGILLYLAAWLMLPDASGRIHLEELFRGRASAGAIAAAVVLGVVLIVPTIVVFFRTIFIGPWGWDAWGVLPTWAQITLGVLWWAVAVPALVIWLITWLNSRSRNQSSAGFAAQAHEFADQASTQANDFAERASTKANEWGNDFSKKADEWGRKVDEKSKEWEKWGHEYRESHRLGAAHVVITLAFTLLVAGTVATLTLAQGGDSNLAFTTGLLAGVVVLAVSTIIAGIRGRESGWIGFLSFCGVVALILAPFSTLLPEDTEVVPFGDSSISAHNVGEDRAVVTIFGNSVVDLSDIRSGATPRTIEVWIAGGNATVRLPESFPTRVRVDLLAGNIRDQRLEAGERRQGGILMSRTVQQHISDSPRQIDVRVRMLGGNVYIEGSGDSRSKAEQDRQIEIEKLKERITELEDAR